MSEIPQPHESDNFVIEVGIVTFVKFVHPAKHDVPIIFIVVGISICVKFKHPEKQ